MRLTTMAIAGFVALVGLAWSCAFAHAGGTVAIDLDWTVPAGTESVDCPSRERVLNHIAALIQGDAQRLSPLHASARITHQETGAWVLSLQVDPGASRVLETQTCEQAGDALAVILAWMMGPRDRTPEPWPVTPAAPPVVAPARPPRPAPAPRAPAPRPQPAVVVPPRAPTPPPAATVAPAPEPKPPRIPWGVQGSVGPLVDRGTFPSWTPGVALAFDFVRPHWSLGTSGALFGERTIDFGPLTDLGGRFHLMTFTVDACARVPFARLVASACGVGELDRVASIGFGVNTPRSSVRVWSALGVRARLERSLTRRWSLLGGAALTAPLERPRFVLDDIGTVTQVGALALRLTVGLEFRLP